ncbi:MULTISPECIES: YggS family pyridoxal phosphate-dependent enzyme [Desulfitobacterium]|uniref:Pyridoxal phosphate homeostasis protein n=1 Tax=Desulfitobacterium dehalogenans (strain ATCC 51507 / DSM 9161 / JW/IU-DC1) TaxID=756499 RepID=I4ACM1_DESDJ|nr:MULTISPECIES: YggS family pyridoxal phosphate-dependent enzyme [Desulfitobacterium]AFM01706.1 pyridoxal phosphate enzyme, YggS family [Desulfitobacterium dehalogenans ATCC 51507]
MDIFGNLSAVQQRIHQAAVKSGRDPSAIKLLAVSKTMSVGTVEKAYEAGQRFFAENRVQEWQDKVIQLPKDCEWHLIGRLQTNKVKYLDERVTLIHSLDRLSLLETLESQGAQRNIVWPTLVQVNIARDSQKAGLLEEEVEDFLTEAAGYKHIRVYGLMTIGALNASPEDTQGFFRQLRLLKERLEKKTLPHVNLKELSMGMSQDFEWAIQEGSTIIRVGRQIFGERIDTTNEYIKGGR